MFERALDNKDIATGKVNITHKCKTVGPPTSTYREGNATVQFEVLPSNTIYNTTLNGSNPTSTSSTAKRDALKNLRKLRRVQKGIKFSL
jgi:hypothetical protein